MIKKQAVQLALQNHYLHRKSRNDIDKVTKQMMELNGKHANSSQFTGNLSSVLTSQYYELYQMNDWKSVDNKPSMDSRIKK